MKSLDYQLFRWINGWPESLEPFFYALSEGNKMLAGRLVLLVIVGTLIAIPKTRRAGIVGLLGFVLANGITEVLKTAVPYARPSMPVAQAMDNGVPLAEAMKLVDYHIRVKPLNGFGTASSHAANTMVFAVALFLARQRVAWLFAVLAVLIGLSRVYVGVHTPFQVLFGWVCGGFAAFLLWEMGAALDRMRGPKIVASTEPLRLDPPVEAEIPLIPESARPSEE